MTTIEPITLPLVHAHGVIIQTAMENSNITENNSFGVAVEASQEKDGPSKWALISLIMSTVALISFISLTCMTRVVTCKVCCSCNKKAKKDQEENDHAEQDYNAPKPGVQTAMKVCNVINGYHPNYQLNNYILDYLISLTKANRLTIVQ